MQVFLTKVPSSPYDSLDYPLRKEGRLLTSTRQLFELEELDLQIERNEDRIASIERQIRDDSRVAGARHAVEQRQEALRQRQVRQARQNRTVSELQEKAKSLEDRMYSNAVRNPREMTALQHEMDNLRAQAKRIEDDELLPLMVQIEEDQEWLAKASPALERMEEERENTVSALTAERTQLEGSLPDLRDRRSGLAATFAPALLSQYEALRQRKRGRAVARIERGMCTGCRIVLPSREIQRARSSPDPVYCTSCGRILLAG